MMKRYLVLCVFMFSLYGFFPLQANVTPPPEWTALQTASFHLKNSTTEHPTIPPRQSDIDPPFTWLTFISSDTWDSSFGAELDSSGNLYVVTNHYLSEDGSYGEGEENEISITKFAVDGRTEWKIPINAEAVSWSESVVIDYEDNLYVSGESAGTWGNPLNPYPVGDPEQALFIAKFRPGDGSLVWNTFLGSNLRLSVSGITTDENNNIYVVWSQENQNETRAYFLAKLTDTGILQWSKVIIPSEGDSDRGFPVDVRVDKDGNIYVLSTNITNWGVPIRELSGGFDVSVAKLDNSGTLLWNTFLGGTGDDISSKVMIEENGDVYVSGRSEATWGNPINLFQQGTDGFLTRLGPDGTLLWNTFVGGVDGLDYIFDMEIGSDGNLYIAGGSESTWGNPANAFAAGLDGFVAQFDPNGSLLWNTFIGGSGNEALRSIAIDASGALRVTGFGSESFGNPVNPALGGGNDVFAARMIIPSTSQAAYRDPGRLVPVLTTYIPTPLDISTDPSVIGANILLAIVLMLPFAVAVNSFSQIISDNEESLMRWFPPLAWLGKIRSRPHVQVEQGTKQRQNLLDALSLVGVAVFYGIVFSLLDETWQPLTAQGLVLLGSMTFSCGIIGFLGDILQWRALRKWQVPAEYKLRATSIFLSAISVGISRSLTLLPGLMFGYPEILKVDERVLNERQNRSLAKISSTTYLVVALGAWLPTIATTILQRGPISNSAREIIGGVEAFLLVVFAIALECIFLELLALSEGLGTKLKKSNRWIWATSLVLCTFAFLHTLLNPRYDLVDTLKQSNITLFIGVVIAFIVITFILRWIFRKREADLSN